jgi:predicted  nucleic acid-binding Zn-ribbon protein
MHTCNACTVKFNLDTTNDEIVISQKEKQKWFVKCPRCGTLQYANPTALPNQG